MIFAGLVGIWLLILLPAVVRHRQEVARPSEAALAGRVLDRPRRPEPEVDDMDDPQTDVRTVDRPPPHFRPGRGGYDPQAAAAVARARSTFRQRVVLTLLVAALTSGVVAAAAVPTVWWVHGIVDVVLVGYLAHLRRQVRTEELIRERRAARMAGTLRHGRAAAGPTIAQPDAEPAGADDPEAPADDVDGLKREEPERVTGTGAPVPRILTSLDELTVESALPRLEPAPPPPLPAGTVLVEELADDLDADLDAGQCTDYRRAAGA